MNTLLIEIARLTKISIGSVDFRFVLDILLSNSR